MVQQIPNLHALEKAQYSIGYDFVGNGSVSGCMYRGVLSVKCQK